MDKQRVLIADDHPIFLEGLSTIISLKYSNDIELVAKATNGLEAVALTKQHKPDVILMDIRMPELNGVAAAKKIREFDKDVKIVMLTTFNESELVSDALSVGINGYILKEKSIPEVISNLRSIVAGNLVLSEKVAQHLMGISMKKSEDPPLPLSEQRDLPDQIKNLSSREKEVLDLMISGSSNHAISEKLFISERTVRNYVSKIYDTVNVHNRESLRLWAMDNGLRLL